MQEQFLDMEATLMTVAENAQLAMVRVAAAWSGTAWPGSVAATTRRLCIAAWLLGMHCAHVAPAHPQGCLLSDAEVDRHGRCPVGQRSGASAGCLEWNSDRFRWPVSMFRRNESP